MKSKDSPTPNLGKPRSNNQIFTYSENKLLDQITIEITEAWKKDLSIIKQYNKKTLDLSKNIRDIGDSFCTTFPKIEKMLQENDFMSLFNHINKQIEQINYRQSEMNRNIFDLENKIGYPAVKSLSETIKKLEEAMDFIKKEQDKQKKKKWWQKLWN